MRMRGDHRAAIDHSLIMYLIFLGGSTSVYFHIPHLLTTSLLHFVLQSITLTYSLLSRDLERFLDHIPTC